VRRRDFRRLRTIAGMDVAVGHDVARAAACVMSYPGLEPVATAVAERPLVFPYVPGLLGFREVPALLAALAELPLRPDLLLVDGHGLAHPRRFGVACHLGVESGLPAIGCAKSLLVGTHRPVGRRRGASTRLVDQGEVIGRCLRTRDGVRPVWVSIGHRIDLDSAVAIVLACTPRYRLPEPIRCADQLAGQGRPSSSSIRRSKSARSFSCSRPVAGPE
jgi:deoxyribonuclease V